MYCKFFELTQAPFNNTPDPKFFYHTPQHEEALACLKYTAEERKGFVLVTGEVGSGKTLLGRLFMQQLGSRARVATVSSSALSPHELMATICHDLEVPLEATPSKTQLIQCLQDYLLDKYAKDRLVLVLLDEAQNLPVESFEELRMLGNLEADDAKLLQVLILAQPEILDVLSRPDMKQLQQRIVRTVHLSELTLEETAGYIVHRLAVAGGQGKVEFTPGAVELIHLHTGGIPRMINHLCDQCLLTAYAQSVKTIDAQITQEVAEASTPLQGAAPRPQAPRPSKPKAARKPQDDWQQLEGRVDEAEEMLTRVETDAVGKASTQADTLRKSLSEDLELRMRQVRGALSELRHDADSIVKRTSRRSEELQHSITENLEGQLEQIQGALSRLTREADHLVDATQHRGQEVRESIATELDGRLGNIKEAIRKLSTDADKVVEETKRRGHEVRESLSEELEGRIGRIQGILERMNQDADGIVEETRRRSRDLRRSLSEDLESRIAQIEDSLTKLTHDADTVVERTTRRTEALQQSMSENLEGRVGKLEQTLSAISKDADNIIDRSNRKASELRDLCDLMRTIMANLAQENTKASEHCTRLAQENIRADELASLYKNARETIALLNQAHKHADKHTTKLAHQVERAEEAVRDIPALINQLQAATTEARTVSSKLDSQITAMKQELGGQMAAMKQQYQQSQQQLAAGQAQVNQMRKLMNVLTAAARAVEIAREPDDSAAVEGRAEALTAPASPAEEKQGIIAEILAAQRAKPPARKRPAPTSAKGVLQDAEDLPPLIEFDPRRAANAHRISQGKGRIHKADSPEALHAKHA
ncbi:MAG: AAA family ATPase [Phycisphaerae bacterium]|nr:AAA family ATPase [Phycisphaerae bacterium]